MNERKFEDDEQVYVLTQEKYIIDIGYIDKYDEILKEYTVITLTDTYVLKEDFIRSRSFELEE